MASVQQRIAENYPFLSFLVRDPQVGPLLKRAVDPNRPFSPLKFQADLMRTNWWRGQSDSSREWQITRATRPGEAKEKRRQTQTAINQMALQLYGRRLPKNGLKWFTEDVLRRGLDPNGPEMMAGLRQVMGVRAGEGAAGVAAQEIRATMENQWFTRRSGKGIYTLAERVVTGIDTMESINARLANDAKRRYPWLQEQINQGMTLNQITEGHRNLIAEEMGVNPATINPRTHPLWKQILGVKDMGDGKMRLPTDHEVTIMARNNSSWWRGPNGRHKDAAMTQALMQTFGKRA